MPPNGASPVSACSWACAELRRDPVDPGTRDGPPAHGEAPPLRLGLGALRLHLAAAARQVQLLDIDAQNLLRPGGGLVQHPPQRLLPQVDLTAGDQPVDRHLRAGRGVGVRHGQPLRPRGRRRAVVAALCASTRPGQHRRQAGVPGVHRGRTPQQFQGLADLVVRHRGQRLSLAEPFDGLADGNAVVPHGVRVAERVEEDVGRRPDGQRLPGRQLDDGGYRICLATDNRAASRNGPATSPQVAIGDATGALSYSEVTYSFGCHWWVSGAAKRLVAVGDVGQDWSVASCLTSGAMRRAEGMQAVSFLCENAFFDETS